MPLEVELKFPVADPPDLRARLTALGAQFKPPQREFDHYHQDPCRDFRATDEAVRLRSIGEENCLTYKGPKLDPHTKTRREIEFPIGSGAENRRLALQWLAATGFVPVAVVAKARVPGVLVWQGREVNLSLDSVDGLGEFAELEVLAEPEDLAGAKEAVLSLAAELGLTNSERRGYLHLLLAQSETAADLGNSTGRE